MEIRTSQRFLAEHSSLIFDSLSSIENNNLLDNFPAIPFENQNGHTCTACGGVGWEIVESLGFNPTTKERNWMYKAKVPCKLCIGIGIPTDLIRSGEWKTT